MKASDVMFRNVITTHQQAEVSEVARLLVDIDISALPVVDDWGTRCRRDQRGRSTSVEAAATPASLCN